MLIIQNGLDLVDIRSTATIYAHQQTLSYHQINNSPCSTPRWMVKKWQTLIEANIDVKTTDGYLLRVFCIGFTNKDTLSQRKTCYAQHTQVCDFKCLMAYFTGYLEIQVRLILLMSPRLDCSVIKKCTFGVS